MLCFVEHRDTVAHVLERDAEFLLALADFIQEPRVLHGDHCLRSEILQQGYLLLGEGAHEFNLSVGERLDPLARKNDDPDHRTLAQQRNAEGGSLLAEPDSQVRIAWNNGHILNMHGMAFERGSVCNHRTAWV